MGASGGSIGRPACSSTETPVFRVLSKLSEITTSGKNEPHTGVAAPIEWHLLRLWNLGNHRKDLFLDTVIQGQEGSQLSTGQKDTRQNVKQKKFIMAGDKTLNLATSEPCEA